MLLAEVVQHPEANLSGLRHGKLGDRNRVKGGAESLLRLNPQKGHPLRGALFLLLSHTITPGFSVCEIRKIMRRHSQKSPEMPPHFGKTVM